MKNSKPWYDDVKEIWLYPDIKYTTKENNSRKVEQKRSLDGKTESALRKIKVKKEPAEDADKENKGPKENKTDGDAWKALKPTQSTALMKLKEEIERKLDILTKLVQFCGTSEIADYVPKATLAKVQLALGNLKIWITTASLALEESKAEDPAQLVKEGRNLRTDGVDLCKKLRTCVDSAAEELEKTVVTHEDGRLELQIAD